MRDESGDDKAQARRRFLGVALGLAAVAAPAAAFEADGSTGGLPPKKETEAEKRAARYRESDHVKAFYRTNALREREPDADQALRGAGRAGGAWRQPIRGLSGGGTRPPRLPDAGRAGRRRAGGAGHAAAPAGRRRRAPRPGVLDHAQAGHADQECLHPLLGRLHRHRGGAERRLDRPGAELGQPDQPRHALRQGRHRCANWCMATAG